MCVYSYLLDTDKEFSEALCQLVLTFVEDEVSGALTSLSAHGSVYIISNLAFVIEVRWHSVFQIKLLGRNNLIYRKTTLQTLHLISPTCL